ncbi:hypothetical protein BHE74_00046011 [Ensete ventricosum]|nr:hypothetical protein BHE74_00046011 [Ensete ventricosum]
MDNVVKLQGVVGLREALQVQRIVLWAADRSNASDQGRGVVTLEASRKRRIRRRRRMRRDRGRAEIGARDLGGCNGSLKGSLFCPEQRTCLG